MSYINTCNPMTFQHSVGIGTTSPSYKLHVEESSPRIHIKGTSGDAGIFMKASSSSNGWTVKDNGSNEFTIFSDSANSHRLYINSSGNVGIGTTSPTLGKLQVNAGGNEVVGFFGSSGMTANQSNYLQIGKDQAVGNNAGEISFKYVGNNNASNMVSLGFHGNGQLLNVLPNGYVGIGTTSPSNRLHVINTGGSLSDLTNIISRFNASTNTAGQGAAIALTAIATKETGVILGAEHTSGNNGDFVVRIYNGGADYPERMRITSGGNVGIGTTSPSYNLVVGNDLGNLSTFSTTSVVGNTSANSFFVIGQSSTRNLQFNWQYNATAGSACGQIVTYGYSNPISIDASRLVLQTLSGGKVGIGTATGNGQLTVSVDQSSNNQHINIVGTQTSYSQEYSLGIPTSTKDFRIYDGTAGATRFTLTTAGNVGIGTTSPASILHANGSGDVIFRGQSSGANSTAASYYLTAVGGVAKRYYAGINVSSANGAFEINDDTCSATRLLVSSVGNVGIGTTTPSYKLHVNGTFYAAGSSIKYKEGICNYDTDSCLFMCLKPVTYQYKEEFKHLGKELKSETQIGLIAEDVAEVMPELAVLVNEEDEKVVRNVDYEKLSIVLLTEVQKLRKEVDELKTIK